MPSAFVKMKTNVKVVRKNLENLRLALPKIGEHRALETSVEIARRMAKPGKKITYPVKWDSLKQKVKVIIMIMRKQGTLPYIRTHAHERGWKSEAFRSGGKVYNSVRGSKYLYGTMRNTKQSNIHVGRYLVLRTVYDAVVAGLPKRIKDSIKQIPKATNG